MGRTLHQISGFFEMVFLVDDPQLWLGVGCNAFSYQDFWWALPATWEPHEYHASPFIRFVRLGSVPFVGSVHIEVHLTEVCFLWIHLPTEMCSSVLSCRQLRRSKNTLINIQLCLQHPRRSNFQLFHGWSLFELSPQHKSQAQLLSCDLVTSWALDPSKDRSTPHNIYIYIYKEKEREREIESIYVLN